MYSQRLQRNIVPVIESHGFNIRQETCNLTSVSWRHVWNVSKGRAGITVQRLESIADEIGADFMDFFAE